MLWEAVKGEEHRRVGRRDCGVRTDQRARGWWLVSKRVGLVSPQDVGSADSSCFGLSPLTATPLDRPYRPMMRHPHVQSITVSLKSSCAVPAVPACCVLACHSQTLYPQPDDCDSQSGAVLPSAEN